MILRSTVWSTDHSPEFSIILPIELFASRLILGKRPSAFRRAVRAQIPEFLRRKTMNTMELNESGLLLTCPSCGRRNRMPYEKLGQTFRCGNCHAELRPP